MGKEKSTHRWLVVAISLVVLVALIGATSLMIDASQNGVNNE